MILAIIVNMIWFLILGIGFIIFVATTLKEKR